MINSVSAVNFRGSVVPAADVINRPGAFAKPDLTSNDAPVKKKGGFLKGLAKLAATAIVVGGALLGAYKYNLLKVLPKAEKADAGFVKKAGDFLARGGEWIDNNIWSKCVAKITAKSAEKVAEKV